MQIVQTDYYSIQRVSNSLLNASIRDGEFPFKSSELGKTFHCALLEPEKYTIRLAQVDNMAAAGKRNLVAKQFFADGNTQYEKEYMFEYMGAKCKAKLDMELYDTVLDFKSTSCKSLLEFEAACAMYGYHRQGYFYLTASGKKIFIIVGVMKSKPFNTFTKIYTMDDDIMQVAKAELDQMITNFLIKNPQYKI